MNEPAPPRGVRRRLTAALSLLLLLLGVGFRLFAGFYTVQPIGALPEGRTLVVWRGEDEPFFNSPDRRCLDRVGSVSLFCRAAAMAFAPTDRIILRLPYQRWAYLQSTGGKEYDR